MKLEAVKDLIAGVAPMVGAALGGPFGAVAGKMVQAALGASTPEEAAEILQSGDPEAILKLRMANIDFLKFMEDGQITREKLEVQDRASARDMAKGLGTSAPQMSIVIGLTVMIGWVLYELFLEAPPKGSENVLFIILGQLTGAWGAAIAFFVGTTKSSSEKNLTMMKMADK